MSDRTAHYSEQIFAPLRRWNRFVLAPSLCWLDFECCEAGFDSYRKQHISGKWSEIFLQVAMLSGWTYVLPHPILFQTRLGLRDPRLIGVNKNEKIVCKLNKPITYGIHSAFFIDAMLFREQGGHPKHRQHCFDLWNSHVCAVARKLHHKHSFVI